MTRPTECPACNGNLEYHTLKPFSGGTFGAVGGQMSQPPPGAVGPTVARCLGDCRRVWDVDEETGELTERKV